jgi:urocanate hydratase
MLMHPTWPKIPRLKVVYGGIEDGPHGRSGILTASFASLRRPQTTKLVVQSGKPIAIVETIPNPRVLMIANSNLNALGQLGPFNRRSIKGLAMYGQMVVDLHCGSQGIVQGTYETFVEAGRHYDGDLTGDSSDRRAWRYGRRAAIGSRHGGACLAVECNSDSVGSAFAQIRCRADTLDVGALEMIERWLRRARRAKSVGLLGDAADVFPGFSTSAPI